MRGRNCVLIVGDDQGVRCSLRNLLVCEGFDVHLAVSGCEGLKLLDRQRIDAAVIDLMMPRLDGVGVCRAILARPAEQRPRVVILISEHCELRRHLGDPSVRRVFPKPFDPRAVADELTRALDAAPRRSA